MDWKEPVTTTVPRYARVLTNLFALLGVIYFFVEGGKAVVRTFLMF